MAKKYVLDETGVTEVALTPADVLEEIQRIEEQDDAALPVKFRWDRVQADTQWHPFSQERARQIAWLAHAMEETRPYNITDRLAWREIARKLDAFAKLLGNAARISESAGRIALRDMADQLHIEAGRLNRDARRLLHEVVVPKGWDDPNFINWVAACVDLSQLIMRTCEWY